MYALIAGIGFGGFLVVAFGYFAYCVLESANHVRAIGRDFDKRHRDGCDCNECSCITSEEWADNASDSVTIGERDWNEE